MDKIISANYQIYRRWFERSLDIIWRLPPELRAKADPMVEVAKAEKKSPSRAVRSVATGIRDTVAMTDRYSESEIRSADEIYEREGLPSLTSMRHFFSKNFLKIINAGIIKSEDDYYILKTLEDNDLPDDVKEEVQRLLGAYEVSR